MNYLQVMHDVDETAITQLQPGFDLSTVGQPNNGALGVDLGANIGTYLGSSDIEGFQAGMMILGLDNEAQDWLTARTTTDGVTLGGFADLKTALAYDMNAPLRWFPGQIAVTETTDERLLLPEAGDLLDHRRRQPPARSRGPARHVLEPLRADRSGQHAGRRLAAVHGLLRRRSLPRGDGAMPPTASRRCTIGRSG